MITRVAADERLREHGGELSPEEAQHLTELATGSKLAGQDARSEWEMAFMRAQSKA